MKSKTITLTAKIAEEFDTEEKGNKIIFSIPKNYDLRFFNREFCNVLNDNQDNNIVCELDTFIDCLSHIDQKILAFDIISKINSFIKDNYVFKSEPNKKKINIKTKNSSLLSHTNDLCFVMSKARLYQTTPNNKLSIGEFVEKIKLDFNDLISHHINSPFIKIKYLDINDIKKEGMELLEAVGKGADEPSGMLVLEYFNNPNSKEKIALVGKGIMMDTGGYDLKPAEYMHDMNQDMTGAALVYSIIYNLVLEKKKVNVVGLLPLAKNMISNKAMTNSDVYKSITGRTVEVHYEDAEGRMILADAIGYANKYYKPSKVISVATLTGTSERAFGDYVTPYWSTQESTKQSLKKSAAMVGESIINLPLFPEFDEIINESSLYADCINASEIINASNSLAANWIKLFCDCKDFTHFDIAGTCSFKKFPYIPLHQMLYIFITHHFGK